MSKRIDLKTISREILELSEESEKNIITNVEAISSICLQIPPKNVWNGNWYERKGAPHVSIKYTIEFDDSGELERWIGRKNLRPENVENAKQL